MSSRGYNTQLAFDLSNWLRRAGDSRDIEGRQSRLETKLLVWNVLYDDKTYVHVRIVVVVNETFRWSCSCTCGSL